MDVEFLSELQAIKLNWRALSDIINQTEEMCLEAVKRNGFALFYVKNQTDKICLEAVKQTGWALEYVKNQTEEICIEAVKKNGFALKYVKNQTNEICLEAIKQEGSALQYIKKEDQNFDICIYAIRNKRFCFDILDYEYLDMDDKRRLEYIKDENMRKECEKYLGDNIRFLNTKSCKQ